MRSLAIAQAWQDAGGTCLFAMTDLLIAPRLEGIPVVRVGESALDLAYTARVCGAAAVILDGYQFGAAHQDAAGSAGARTLLVDDAGQCLHWSTDLVLDPNVAATGAPYVGRHPRTQLLLGARFALVRREFLSYRRPPKEPEQRVLVSFGGADPAELSGRAIEALAGLDVTLLIGAANPARARLEDAANRAGMRVLYDATNMPELMASADLAVVAAGGTCTELAFMGVPALAVITAENQRVVATGFQSRGTLRSLGDANELTAPLLRRAVTTLLLDVSARRAMSDAGRATIDGLGPKRVVEALA